MTPSTTSVLKCDLSKHLNILSFALVYIIFHLMAYYTVSDFPPNSVPVHHDDYTNYSSAGGGLAWSWVRPLSTWLIFVLSSLGPDWLIWTVRLFTAAYVFLCWKIVIECIKPRHYWITLVLFAVASLSSPIVAEYARYTGMVTHLMSGCLGLAAVYVLFKDEREKNDAWIYASIVLLLLSALAKEDFILFYALTLFYILFKSKKAIKKRALIGLTGLTVSLMLVGGAKFLAKSSFLGLSDSQSTYFIDISPTSVATTVWRYLVGGGHPALELHGKIVITAMIFSCVLALFIIVRDKTIPKTLYLIGAALTLIAPYSVLPNHINAYYELIWLPFIIGSVYVAIVEAISTKSASSQRVFLANALFAILCVPLSFVDTSGRSSIAHWYDTIGSENAKVFKFLEKNRAAINAAPSVCIYGANAFSPWYMHNGQYLKTVMNLYTTWNIIIDTSSQLYSGFQQGATSSNGQIVVSETAEMSPNCLKLSIG